VPSLCSTSNLNCSAAPAGTETVSRPLPVEGMVTGPIAPLKVVAQLPNSATLPESMMTSVLANVGVPPTLKLTGINVDVLTLKGAAFEVVPCVTVTVAAPATSAGTTAVICPLLQLVTVAGSVVEPTLKFTVPAVAPKLAPLMVTAAPGLATRGVTLPMEGGTAPAETQMETLLCGSVKLVTGLLLPAVPVTAIPTPPMVCAR